MIDKIQKGYSTNSNKDNNKDIGNSKNISQHATTDYRYKYACRYNKYEKVKSRFIRTDSIHNRSSIYFKNPIPHKE